MLHFMLMVKAIGKLVVVADLDGCQFDQKKLVEEIHLVFNELIVVLQELHLDAVKVLNRQTHDLSVGIAPHGELALQQVFSAEPIDNFKLVFLISRPNDVNNSKRVAFTYSNVFLIVTLWEHITTLSFGEKEYAPNVVTLKENILFFTEDHWL